MKKIDEFFEKLDFLKIEKGWKFAVECIQKRKISLKRFFFDKSLSVFDQKNWETIALQSKWWAVFLKTAFFS